MTLEEIKNTFTIKRFIESYQSGRLQKLLLEIGEKEIALQLEKYNIPRKGELSGTPLLLLCQAFFPSKHNMPMLLSADLDEHQQEVAKHYSNIDDDDYNDIMEAFAQCKTEGEESLRFEFRNDNGSFLSFFPHKPSPGIWFIAKHEIGRMIATVPKEQHGVAMRRFMTSEPMFSNAVDLSYAISDISMYIYRITNRLYNIKQYLLEENCQKNRSELFLAFSDYQPMYSPSVCWKVDSSGENVLCFRFSQEQLKSLLGLSRREISKKVFAWIEEAHLFTKDKSRSGAKLTTLEEVKDRFTVEDFVSAYQSGELKNWLLQNGKTLTAKRLEDAHIPKQGQLSHCELLRLCEFFYPKFKDLPERIQSNLPDDEDDYAVCEISKEEMNNAFSSVAHFWHNYMSFCHFSDSNDVIKKVFFSFKNDEKKLVKFCVIYPNELYRLIHETPSEELGETIYRFVTTTPLFESGRDLGYVIRDLKKYVDDVTQYFYDLANYSTINYSDYSSLVVFKNTQPMDDPHMTLDVNPNLGLFHCYRIDQEQMASLIGLSRTQIAAKVLGWFDDANLNMLEDR